ncbi:MAG: hypothetical protein KatS3mg087_1810 [Patescibacteria group bacterium]|nr:MAG: hypothetical protein KatS3mg087_1810 [Patescibacteria group bacterium]
MEGVEKGVSDYKVSGLSASIGNIIVGIIDTISKDGKNKLGEFSSIFLNAISSIKTGSSATFKAIQDDTNDILSQLITFIRGSFSETNLFVLQDFILFRANYGIQWSYLNTDMVSAADRVRSTVVDAFTNMKTQTLEQFSLLRSGLITEASNINQDMMEIFVTGENSMIVTLRRILLEGDQSPLFVLGRDMINAIVRGIQASAPVLASAISSVVSNAISSSIGQVQGASVGASSFVPQSVSNTNMTVNYNLNVSADSARSQGIINDFEIMRAMAG